MHIEKNIQTNNDDIVTNINMVIDVPVETDFDDYISSKYGFVQYKKRKLVFHQTAIWATTSRGPVIDVQRHLISASSPADLGTSVLETTSSTCPHCGEEIYLDVLHHPFIDDELAVGKCPICGEFYEFRCEDREDIPDEVELLNITQERARSLMAEYYISL